MIPIEQIDPNPNQPRQVMGDLSELIASIAEKGIIEPIVVRQRGDRFQIIRRTTLPGVGPGRPARVAGSHPRVDDTEILEIALIENLQRKDLTPSKKQRRCRTRQGAATRTKTWRGGWASPAPPSRSR